MMRKLVALAVASLLAAPVTAQTYRTENHVLVTAVPSGFEVASGGGYGASGIWCAAADYAREVLGAAGTSRIYVAQGRRPGLGQRGPVRFTLDPTGLVPRATFIVGASLRHAGSTLSVDHAYIFCADAKIINR